MKASISAKIPVELYENIQEAIKQEKYESNTECIIKGLNLLLSNPDQENTEDKRLLQEKEKEIQNLQEEVKRSKEEIQGLQGEVNRSKEEVNRSKEKISILQEDIERAPDLVEFAQLQARYEGLQEIIKEKEKSIERLENDLLKAGQREEDLKNMHNNYMLQVQSLINARALTPSGSTKEEKPKHESKPVREKRESRYREKEERVYATIQDESPAIKESLDIEPEVKPEETKGKQKTCLHCGETFTAARSTRLFCSGRCKTAYGRKKEASGLT